LLYYTKGKPKFFNRPRVPIPVCRHCGGDIKDYGDHRNKLYPDGLNLTDVWTDIPPVRHTKTKCRGPSELSIKLRPDNATDGLAQIYLYPVPSIGSGKRSRVHQMLSSRQLQESTPTAGMTPKSHIRVADPRHVPKLHLSLL
jgi:site-specific DNA-methyltransferase (adenine-specific)